MKTMYVAGILEVQLMPFGLFCLRIRKLLGNKGVKVKSYRTAIRYLNCHLFTRDLDFNANRQYFLSTCGDDGYMKFWDIRFPSEPALSRMEHSHWVWNIRINRFHDQLVLTSSSDSSVILCSIASISSEPFGHIVSAEDESCQNGESCGKKK